MQFQDLSIIPPILKALTQEGYQTPTPIQAQAIPPILAGKDLLGCAQTGTGKTAAFAIPILQLLSAKAATPGMSSTRALILTPTRELALQIYESFQAYGRYTKLRSCVLFGGVSQKPQEQALRMNPEILIATPGRLGDLINQRLVDLRRLEIFVLDEADRMLDMGFIHDVKRIAKNTPARKQTLLFSATMPPEIASMATDMLHQPVQVQVTPVSSTVESIEQSVYFVDKTNKRHLLLHLLQQGEIGSALVFTRTKHGADRVTRELTRAGIHAQAIHGNKSQNARQLALSSFKSGATRVLVATDIAARGIDIDALSHVINFDLPNLPETYVHRIGRTGRAGLSGIAISFCDWEERPYLADIEKLSGKRVPVVSQHPFPAQILPPPPTPKPAPKHHSPTSKPQSARAAAPSNRHRHRPRRPSTGGSAQ